MPLESTTTGVRLPMKGASAWALARVLLEGVTMTTLSAPAQASS